jgi:hypothetical protein
VAVSRQEILGETPVGSTFEQVLQYCARRKLKCYLSKTAGFLNQDTGKAVGTESIWAQISEQSFFLIESSVTAYWGFGNDGRLLDIWVWRTNDAP